MIRALAVPGKNIRNVAADRKAFEKVVFAYFVLRVYNLQGWTCKPMGDYSLSNSKHLQATGTTYNDEKLCWYWIGTKKFWNEK
jgi:hypothetical protein